MRGVSKHAPSPLRGDAKAHGHPQRANASRPSLAAGEAQAAQTLSAENSDGDTCRPTAKDAQLSEWPVYTRPTIAPINCALAGSGLGPVLKVHQDMGLRGWVRLPLLQRLGQATPGLAAHRERTTPSVWGTPRTATSTKLQGPLCQPIASALLRRGNTDNDKLWKRV